MTRGNDIFETGTGYRRLETSMRWLDELAKGLERHEGSPLHTQLAEAVSDAVRSGLVLSGERMPSVRSMSDLLKINPGTVVSAYKELSRLGYLESRRGSGHYVRGQVRAIGVTHIPDLIDELYTLEDIEWMQRGTAPETRNDMLNMASGTPDADALTQEDLRLAFSHVMNHSFREALDYQEPMGYPPLRQLLVEMLTQEGIRTDTEGVQIISGAQQGIDIVAKALLEPGDVVLVEYPTYPGAVAVFRSRGARVVGVPIGPDGVDPDHVAEMMRRYRPKLFYTIPVHQNPTGAVYTEAGMKAVLQLAETFGCLIVEDDSLRELQYDGPVRKPLKYWDLSGRVLFVKSHSKLLMPGLRIAYMTVPQERSARLALAKHTTDIFTSGLIQQGFYRFCQMGGQKRHLTRLRQRMGLRHQTLLKLLKQELREDTEVPGRGGGLSFWLGLPAYAGGEALYRMAAARGLRIVPDHVYVDEGILESLPVSVPRRAHARVSFAAMKEADMPQAVEILADSLEEMRRKPWMGRDVFRRK